VAIEGTDSLLTEVIGLITAARYPDAEEMVKSGWGEAPSDARAIYLSAEIKLRTGDLQSALLENRKLAGSTNNLMVLTQHANILVGLGELDKATSVYKEMLVSDPQHAEAARGLEQIGALVRSRAGRRTVPRFPGGQPGLGVASDFASEEAAGFTNVYTARDEHFIIERLLDKLRPPDNYLIDIGAADGVDGSNSYHLLLNGWRGLAIEPRIDALASISNAYKTLPQRVDVLSIYTDPVNVCRLFEALGVPAEPGFISLDIDSFEYEMVEAMLQKYRPYLLCVEINERIPPPVRFSILYDPGRIYGDISILGGCSIQMMTDLLNRLDYAVVCLEPHP
jgi:tetratricopeptide (TPR) repeat protein